MNAIIPKVVVCLSVNLLLFTLTGWSQSTVQDWQKKAVADFPDIGVKGSEMNAKFIQRVQVLQRSDRALFNNPKWPYIIAEEVAKGPIIPGMENVVVPSPQQPAATRPSATPMPTVVHAFGEGNIEIIPAADASTKAVVGQMVGVQGVIVKTVFPAMAAEDHFYIQLQPDILCEFAITPFFNRSERGLGPGMFHLKQPQLKFEEGAIFVYADQFQHPPRGRSYYQSVKIGEILKPGEIVNIYGRNEGSGSAGLQKGLILRDCSVLPQH